MSSISPALNPASEWDTRLTQPEEQTDERTPEQWASYWKEQIAIAEREHKPYWAETAIVTDRYRNAMTAQKKRRRFNVLYANVETLRGAIYAKSGKPDVRPRWATEDKIARTGSELMERSLVTSIDTRAHETATGASVLAAILAGRGVMRIDYEARVAPVEMPQADAGFPALPLSAGEAGPAPVTSPLAPVAPTEEIVDQKITKAFVRTADFLHNPATCWSEVWWIAYRVRMTREDMRENGFKSADKIALNWAPKNESGEVAHNASDNVKRCELWEVWSKTHKKRFWLPMDAGSCPRIDDDPYNLEHFFNCPEPLTFHAVGNMIPFLEFFQYETLADDLDEIHNRIAMLTRALKRRGIRDKAIKGLEKLARANDNEFVDVESWQQLVQKGGLKGVFETEDIEPVARVLTHLIQIAVAIEGKIDRMTGIADIMRGASEGGAKTATEQQIKAQYGGVRIKTRQREVERFIRDVMRIECEIIAEHFEPKTLQDMTGIQVSPEVMQMLRSDRARGFRIDIETDSTVFEDAAAEKQTVNEAVQTAMSLMEKGMAAIQQAPEFAEVVFESLALLLRHIKGGRTMQDVIDRAKQKMQQRLQQAAQQPPPPDPEQIKAQAAMQQAQMKMQADQAALQAKMRADSEAAKMKLANEEMKLRISLQVEEIKAAALREVENAKLEQQAELAWRQSQIEEMRIKAELAMDRAELAIKQIEARAQIDLAREKLAHDKQQRDDDRELKDRHAHHKHEADAQRSKEKMEAAE